ncbi:MAG TPA: glutamate 5-kinase [Nitrospinae bacterium]|nr:glutamate 5-kinase [Nitrospinota bacterium]
MNRKKVLKKVRRIVIKIGSGVLTSPDRSGLDDTVIEEITRQVSTLHKSGYEMILVSSGAIAAGVKELNLKKTPVDIPHKQAAAAIGQSRLIGKYERHFKREGLNVAQILLTHDDLSNRIRYLNAKNTILTILSYKVIPIINENDTVAVDEIKFGDNDTLSSMVSNLIEADLLIILSDVKGLYSADPKLDPAAELVPVVEKITNEIEVMAGDSRSATGVGGMVTKIQAAKRMSHSGIPTVIVDGKVNGIIEAIVKGEDVGTLFLPEEDKLGSKKYWIAYTLKSKGKIKVDDGAKNVLIADGKSLLPSGVVEIEGKFKSGDMVSCIDSRNREFARGLINYSSTELKKIRGKHSSEFEEILGYKMVDEAIHRDNLVIL